MFKYMSLVVAKPLTVAKAAPRRKTWGRRRKPFMSKGLKWKRYNNASKYRYHQMNQHKSLKDDYI